MRIAGRTHLEGEIGDELPLERPERAARDVAEDGRCAS
jgi:hypothetical protein